jgi:hypothetical protein
MTCPPLCWVPIAAGGAEGAVEGGEAGSAGGPVGAAAGAAIGTALGAAIGVMNSLPVNPTDNGGVPGGVQPDATSTRRPSASDIVGAVNDLGGKATPHPTKTGEGVVIDFGDGTKIDVRVENHPPLGHHGNVQVWEGGKEVGNSHVTPPQPQPGPPAPPSGN